MTTLTIETLPAEQPYSALFIHTGKYPLPPEVSARANALSHSLLDSSPSGALTDSLFFQQEFLKNGKQEFDAHLQQWRPQPGLGVWPDRPAPRLWRTSDMFRMIAGERVPLMYRVLRLAAGPPAAKEAFDRMMGSGMVMAIAHPGSTDSLLQLYKNKYLPGITEPNLRIMPFYVPLLDVKSIHDRNAAQLSDWLGSARLYIRESPEDKGILVITNLEADPLLKRAGARNDRPGRWLFQ